MVSAAAAHSPAEARHLEQMRSGHLGEYHSSAAGLPPALLPAQIELSALFDLRLLAAASSLLGVEVQQWKPEPAAVVYSAPPDLVHLADPAVELHPCWRHWRSEGPPVACGTASRSARNLRAFSGSSLFLSETPSAPGSSTPCFPTRVNELLLRYLSGCEMSSPCP